MNSVSSSSISATSSSSASSRPAVPGLAALPDEVFLNIVSFIHKADNETLCSLASASHDCWRLVSVDSLRSFFYAAHSAFLDASVDGKAVILAAVLEWMTKVSGQLPAETVNTIWSRLIDMTNNAELKAEDKFMLSEKILESVKLLMPENPNEAYAIDIVILLNRASFCFSSAQQAFTLQFQMAHDSLHAQLNSLR